MRGDDISLYVSPANRSRLEAITKIATRVVGDLRGPDEMRLEAGLGPKALHAGVAALRGGLCGGIGRMATTLR